MVDNIQKQNFSSILFEKQEVSLRVASKELSRFIDDENTLRDMIGRKRILYQKENNLTVGKAYESLEEICQINMDTLKKTISGRIKVTRNFIYKFAVGLHMTLEEANEYFKLNGGELRESCLADYICMQALRDKDDISVFIDQFERHTDSRIGMRVRQTK